MLEAEPRMVSAQTQGAPTILESGVVVERSIGEGDRHLFQIAIADGQAVKIAVDQIGSDVAIEAGTEQPITIDDADKHHYGRELAVDSPPLGWFAIAVRAKSTIGRAGRYRLTATVYPAGDHLALAVRSFTEARSLLARPKRDGASDQQAAADLQQALAEWRQLGDREMVAACLSRLGALQQHDLVRPADAIPLLTEAAAIYEDLGQPTEAVAALSSLGTAQVNVGQADRSLATFERSYRHAPDVDPLVRAEIEDDIARATMDTGDLDRAATFAERAAGTFRGAGDGHEEFFALERLALVYSRLRRFDDALSAITRAIELGRQYGDGNDVATLTLSAGRIQMTAGDDDLALAAFSDSLTLFKGQPSNRIVALLAMGRIYDRRGDGAHAKEVLEQGLAQVPAQMRDLWAAVASELGVSLTLVGEPARALDLQQKALGIVDGAQSRIGQLTVLRDLAGTRRALGDLEGAGAVIDRADELGREVPGRPYTALFMRERARNARAAGDLAAARRYLDQALAAIESERGTLQSQALRASFGGTLQDYYADAIDVEIQMHAAAPDEGHDARAFELFERSRARGFTDLLSESRVDVRAGVDPALVDEQRTLQRQLGLKDTALRDPGAKNRERAAALEREIADIERQLAVLDARIRSSSPRYAELTHPAPATLRDTQALLDDRTVLLALAVGPTSWGWAITRTSLDLFPLPPASRIEEQARRLYADLLRRQHPDARRPNGVAEIDHDFSRDAGALSDLVLGPIADRLSGEWRGSRLAVVATGPLEYVPFAALPAPRAADARTRPREWLIDRHELVQLPSVSVLQLLRAEPEANATADVAILADPVYSVDDPRVHPARAGGRRAAAAVSAPADPVLRGATADTRGGLGRLVFSREEAKAIAELASKRGVVEALDFRASVGTIASARVAGARIVHVASHGIFNTARPELSGLVLSLVDERGRPEEGVLHLYDVLNLKLSADLVVLSGCQTGLGRQMKGEGLVGLSRAFMYAGARRVVASLWEVDDLATAELMRRFYHGLLVGRLAPAAALAVAQRQVRADPRWRAPFYWAGFTLIGDWR